MVRDKQGRWNLGSTEGEVVIMTHDELLDYLREHEEYWTSLRAQRWAKVPAFNALRAVMELHKPETITTPCPDGKSGCLVLHYSDKQKCFCGFWNYPCPTIQAIEKELK